MPTSTTAIAISTSPAKLFRRSKRHAAKKANKNLVSRKPCRPGAATRSIPVRTPKSPDIPSAKAPAVAVAARPIPDDGTPQSRDPPSTKRSPSILPNAQAARAPSASRLCPICEDELKVAGFPGCGHRFCEECLAEHSSINSSCPCCDPNGMCPNSSPLKLDITISNSARNFIAAHIKGARHQYGVRTTLGNDCINFTELKFIKYGKTLWGKLLLWNGGYATYEMKRVGSDDSGFIYGGVCNAKVVFP